MKTHSWACSHPMGYIRHVRSWGFWGSPVGLPLNAQAATERYGNYVVMPNLSSNEISRGIFRLWAEDLGFTWLGVSLLCIVPAVFYGSAIFSVSLLIAAVLIGIPSALFGIANKQSRNRGIRRLVILLAVPALTLAVVSHLDKQIPANATPLIIAIETFRHDTGHYPESLDKLIPKQLAKIPNVRFSLFEPPIIYRITDGIPYLAIPSAMGDMFAQFEYDFEAKVWMHQS